MKKPLELEAPQSWHEATEEVRRQVVNGCGPGGWKFDIIPDNLYGLSIVEACNIHDWMYTIGETLSDKVDADRMFLRNMKKIINHEGGFIIKLLRLRAAKGYYAAVKNKGFAAFWAGKNIDAIIHS